MTRPTLPPRGIALLVSLLLLFACATAALAQATSRAIPTPESVFGFRIGEDRRLAKWDEFLTWFRKLSEASDRVRLEELGRTTLKRPFVAVTISSAENLRRLEEFKEIQQKLADPRLLTNAGEAALADLIRRGRTVVVITCSIHSTEVGGTFTGAELAYRLASQNTPETQAILENVILLLVPSLNPDGTDLVTDWYRRTLGTPSEGTAPPELYHHYVGHDNNRDWYAFSQTETQLTVDRLLNVWHPQILHDIHQMGGSGARYFIPPYIDPWEPNIDPALTAGVSALGTSVAWEMITQGKTGVVVNGIFDAWTPSRAYAHYHAGLRILSETASARLATPVEVPFAALRPGQNYNAQVPSWNFPAPWQGGAWTLRDIIDYQTTGAMALLNHAARHRELYLRNFYAVGKRALEARGMPFAILLPEPEVPKSLADAFKRLNEGLKKTTGTKQEKHEQSEELVGQISNEPSTGDEVVYYYKTEGLDRLISILRRGGVEVMRANQDFKAEGRSYPAGTHIVFMKQPYAAFAKTLLEKQVYPDLREFPGGPPKPPYDVVAHTLPLLMNVQAIAVRAPFEVESRPEPTALVIQARVRPNAGVRVGMYKSFAASMDEGWTRWVFDQYRFPFRSLFDADIRDGNLTALYDVIILPDQSVQAIVNGLPAAGPASPGYPAEYAGGLGEAGIKSLRAFIEAGGTVVTFNNASNFAIERLGVPARNLLKGVPAKEFYCPGSILKVQLDAASPISFGLEKESIAWFENSPVFEITDPATVKAIARYPDTESPLLSGWILGENLLRGKAALLEARIGKGRVLLFGFRPQYRGQSLATLPLLFNAMLTSK
ncbi:MAG: M14 family metallopeptidase [Blastocatellia bacterium]|nr:M14 family metallopeptidase [Blastocatellia bacterium]